MYIKYISGVLHPETLVVFMNKTISRNKYNIHKNKWWTNIKTEVVKHG